MQSSEAPGVKGITPKVVVVGSINCDLTTYLEKFPRPNETVMGLRSFLTLGGKGLNQAVAAARVGADVQMLACVGRDNFGTMARDYLAANRVATTLLRMTDKASTGTASVLVDSHAHNMIAVATGANGLLTPGDVYRAEPVIAAADVLIVQMELPFETVKAALMLAASYGVTTVLNPAPASTRVLELLPYASVVTPNETELELIAGVCVDDESGLVAGLKKMNQAGARLALVTRGEKGCIFLGDEAQGVVPAFRVAAIDSTGAGDVFNGVFAASLVAQVTVTDSVEGRFCEQHLQWAIGRASAAAALSVTRPLAQDAAPFTDEIDALMSAQSLAAHSGALVSLG